MVHDHVADAGGHAGIDHLEGGHRRVLRGYSQGLRQMLPHRPLRRLPQQRHAAAEKVVGIEVSQQQVDVRAGGQRAPVAVASRTWRGPRAPGAYVEPSSRVDPGDAAAAGAEGADVDHGQRRGVTPDATLCDLPRFAVRRQGNVETGTTHVDDRAVGGSGGTGVNPRRHGRGRRTGEECRRGSRDDLRGRHQPGRGVHDEQLAGKSGTREARRQGQQVRPQQRTHVAVQHRGAHPVVVA